MINIKDLTNKYKEEGYDEIYASAKVAQDIILTYLFKSEYKNNITIKGGIVMYNLSNNIRRATIDIDLDLIRIYLADDNLYNIFTSYKIVGIDIIVSKEKIVNLKHQDYKGKRIPLIIRDNFGNEITTKIDVGIHTEFDITQDELYFNSCIENQRILLMVNSKEQIFVEKLIPVIKFGLLSTRYKDFYDLYWLIKNGNMDASKVVKILNNKVFRHKINDVDSLEKLINIINNILSDKNYIKVISNRKNNWLDVEITDLKDTIINYLKSNLVITV